MGNPDLDLVVQQVNEKTSLRRKEVIDIAEGYATAHPEVACRTQGEPLKATEWKDLLRDSKFTLCPGGHNPITYRIYEALEAG